MPFSETKNNFTVSLFNCLNRDEIQYAVMRNYAKLPYSTGSSDLDIWINGPHHKLFQKVLRNVLYVNSGSIVSMNKGENYEKWCILNINSGLQIDLFIGDIFYKNYPIITSEVIIQNTENYGTIPVLNKKLADLIAFLKEIINNGVCTEKYVLPLYEQHVFTLEYLTASLTMFSKEFIETLNNLINQRDLESNFGTLSRLAKQSVVKYPNLDFIYKIRKLSRLLKPLGYVIVVTGTDGSGKSTIINEISPILNEAFHKGVRYVHLRPGFIPDLGVLLGKKEKSDVPVIVTDPHAQKASGFLGSLFRWGYYLIDYTFGYLFKVYPDKSVKNHAWIFDRYYYDYYLDQKRLRVHLPEWLVKAGEFFVPSPDIILCLGGDPQKIFERKPETDLKEVTRQVNDLKIFCSKHKKTVWIDTCTSREESVRQAMTAICEMMGKRFANQSDK